MGKLLRNRQVLDQTDFQFYDQTQTNQPQMTKISKNTLKKTICKKFTNREKNTVQKHSNFFKNLQKGSLSTIVDQTKYECPICLELMVRPTLMNCGHMYCYRCLESNTAHSSSCCLCRQKQNPDEYVPSAIAQNIINQVLVPRSNEIIKYLCRISDTSEWIKRRKINNIRPGLIIDFQDSFKVWRRAIVLKTYIGKDQKLMVSIKTFFKGTEILETLQASSKRLAPLNFFTRSKYLEDFVPTLPQYDIYEKQLQRLEYRHIAQSQQQFNFDISQYQSPFPLQQLQQQHQQVEEGSVDQALALFDWEMNVGQLLF